jgi:quinol monooxygenase YgiN
LQAVPRESIRRQSRYFLLYEHYADQGALDAHRNTPHFKEIIEGVIVPLLEKRERELYQSVIA